MVLACQNIDKAYNDNIILKNINFHIEERERVAVVGANGAGKTTLLRIITGNEEADSGNIIIAKDKELGYLTQNVSYESDLTIYEAMREARKHIFELEKRIRDLEVAMKSKEGDELEALLTDYNRLSSEFELKNGYATESEITGVIKGLGFTEEEFNKKISLLSGGQKTRVALGRLLLTSPDILLLDEPTNHLDMDSIAWLEGYLSSYRGSVLIVSHDRYFLDILVTKVVEIENGRSEVFNGNYSFYATKREELRDIRLKAYLNQQAEIAHQEAVIEKLKSFNREKSIKRAESREKMLNKVERLEKPQELKDAMRLSLEPEFESGEDVLFIEHLKKSFGDHTLFSDVNMDIKRGERIALIGANGTGKTTILKIINRLTSKDDGRINLGARVKIGYYDQEHHVLSPEKTIFEEISDAYPKLTNTRIRNLLAAFLFTGDDVFKQIKDLSGGEQGRVALAKLMLSSANFLILDEPTNHLDITSKEILEEALNNYSGTVLYVSHDRYFINRTATRIYELMGDVKNEGNENYQMLEFTGNYDRYLELKELPVYKKAYAIRDGITFTEEGGENEAPVILKAETAAKADWKADKAEQARIRKLKNDIKKAEDKITELEGQLEELNKELADPENATNSAKLTEITTKQAKITEELENEYENWEELQTELE
ncbi:MAG: ABC-F family ATP-binding cassette domain-containing protein [Lachnospiraceae bacterium]|nr:ABC-F family ATP-binding cassette domain-containing protein [Lachnospiraceae bacterium]